MLKKEDFFAYRTEKANFTDDDLFAHGAPPLKDEIFREYLDLAYSGIDPREFALTLLRNQIREIHILVFLFRCFSMHPSKARDIYLGAKLQFEAEPG